MESLDEKVTVAQHGGTHKDARGRCYYVRTTRARPPFHSRSVDSPTVYGSFDGSVHRAHEGRYCCPRNPKAEAYEAVAGRVIHVDLQVCTGHRVQNRFVLSKRIYI